MSLDLFACYMGMVTAPNDLFADAFVCENVVCSNDIVTIYLLIFYMLMPFCTEIQCKKKDIF